MNHYKTLSLMLVLTLPLQAQGKKAPDAKSQEAPKSQKVEVKPDQRSGREYRKYVREQARKAEENAKREAIADKIRKTRARLKKQGVLQSHIQVKVTLRNDEVMRGVVKNGLFIEKPTRLEFVRAEMKVAGAGIRLWYYNRTSGYIFLPYRTIRTYKILRRMTQIEVSALHDKLISKKALAKSQADKAQEKIDKNKAAVENRLTAKKTAIEEKQKTETEMKAMSEETKLRALLNEFPPDQGWGPEKAAEIRMRFINVGVSPDPKSKRFLDNLSAWKKAYGRYANEDKNKKPVSKPKVTTPAPLK